MRTATTVVLAASVAAIVGGTAAPGCYGATEISVAVTTTVACSPSLVMTTQIFTGSTGTTDFGTAPAAETIECGPSEPRIGTLSVVPSGARDGQFDLEVVGAVGVPASQCRDASLGRDGGAPGGAAASSTTGCVVARRRVSFRPHKALTVPVLLSARCIGVPCGVDQTCDLGICTSTVDCTDQGCPRERGDVPAPVADASADAATDAPVDAPVTVDGSVPRCGTSREVVISGQAIVGQLVMQGSDFLYVNAASAPGAGGVVTEIRRVPRAGAMTALVVDAPPAQLNAAYVAVAASGADLAWATQAPGPFTTIVWPKLSTFKSVGADHASLAISGQAVVGFWHDVAAAQFVAFVLGGMPASVTTGASALPGAVPEVLVDDTGDFYGVSGGASLVHYTIADPSVPVEVGKLTTLGNLVPDIAVAKGRVYAAAEPERGRGIWRIARAAIIDTYSDPVWISLTAGVLPQSMTSDGAFLYYLAGTSLSRADVAVAAGAPGVGIHFGDTGPSADRLQVDDQCVYWVEGGTTIMKRLKQ